MTKRRRRAAGVRAMLALVAAGLCAAGPASADKRGVRIEPAAGASPASPTGVDPNIGLVVETTALARKALENVSPSGPWDWRLSLLEQAVTLAFQRGNRLDQQRTLIILGSVQSYAGQHKLAVATHEKGCRLGLRRRDCLFHLGCDYEVAGDHVRALATLERASREPVPKFGETYMVLPAQVPRALAIVQLAMGNAVEAERSLRQALALLMETARQYAMPTMRGPRLSDAEVDLRRLLVRALVQQQKPEAALEEAERARAAPDGAAPTEPGVRSPARLAALVSLARAQATTLISYAVEYDDNPRFLSSFSPNGSFRVGHHDMLRMVWLDAWVISPDGRIGFRRTPVPADLQSLGDALSRLFAGWGVRGPADLPAAREAAPPVAPTAPAPFLARLGGVLLRPIADLLPVAAGARLVIVPQDDLFFVPFIALPLDEAGTVAVVDRYIVSLATSLGGIDPSGPSSDRAPWRARCPQVAAGALVVGNPAMPTLVMRDGTKHSLRALPGAAAEATDVARLLRAHALVGEQATKQAVRDRLEGALLIHMATHGLVDHQDPWFSGLALAPTSTDEGFLTRREIESLHACAELAVLSACGTGTGPLDSDGVASLTGAFFAAGVPRIVMSLWSVDDQATATYMHELYTALARAGDVAASARTAALAVRRAHPHPRHWAAMTVIGAPTPLPSWAAAARGDVPLRVEARDLLDDLPVPQGAFGYQRTSGAGGMMMFLLPASTRRDETVRFYRAVLAARGCVIESEPQTETTASILCKVSTARPRQLMLTVTSFPEQVTVTAVWAP